jgi:20S proteasome alpha/beta subunit
MSNTGTIIVALKYRDGVLIGADSQASDPPPPGTDQTGVRWTVTKLRQIGKSPIVTGFSGSWGTAERVLDKLSATKLYPGQMADRASIQKALEKDLVPEVNAALQRYYTGHADKPLVGLSAMWIAGEPLILEHEWSGDSCWHPHFHAAGSGKQTAYAIYHTLGRTLLCELPFEKAIMALLRILITSIDVEMYGVSKPIHVWNVTSAGANQLVQAEVDTHAQAATLWIKKERDAFFGSAGLATEASGGGEASAGSGAA